MNVRYFTKNLCFKSLNIQLNYDKLIFDILLKILSY